MATEDMLASKISPPRVGVPLLPRPRLARILRDGLSRKVVILAAEAGYGKTSLLLSVLPELELPTAWYTLDETDAAPTLLAAGIVAAVRNTVPHFGEEVLSVLTAGPNPHLLRHRLLKSLESLPDLLLVLDDAHAVDGSPDARALLDDLAAKRPSRVRLVLATRTTPELATLPRLLVEGNAIVLDRSALAFTPEEAAAFLRHNHGLEVTPQQADHVVRRTEGWAAALQLAALRAKTHGVSSLEGTPVEVFHYLATSVLTSLSNDVQEFLLRTSILAEMWPELCAAVVPSASNPAALLAFIDRRNLFVYRLDAEGTRYRYHQLFAEFLRRQLAGRGADHVASLHRLAGRYLEEHSVPDQAVRHYFAGEALEDAERVMKPLHGERLTARLAHVFRAIVRALPEDLQFRFPWMTRCGASSSRFVGDYHGALELARRAMEAAEAQGDQNLWTFSAHGIAVMYQHLDRYEDAVTVSRNVLSRLTAPVEDRFHAAALVVLADSLIVLGRLDEAERTIAELEGVVAKGTRPGRGYATAYLRGLVASARWQVRPALDWFQRARAEGRERGSLSYQVWALTALAMSLLWARDPDAAARVLQEARDLHAQTAERAAEVMLTVLAGDLALLEGDAQRAAQLHRKALADWQEGESEMPRFWTLLGLARAAGASLDEAESLFRSADQVCRRIHYRFGLPHLLLAQASHHRQGGRVEESANAVRELRGIFEQWRSPPGLAACSFFEAYVQAQVGTVQGAAVKLAEALDHTAGCTEDILPLLRAQASWIVPLLLTATRESKTSKAAETVLVAIGAPSVGPLIEALRDPNHAATAVRLLGQIADARARRPLAALAKSADRRLRQPAEQALALLREPRPTTLRVFLFGRFEVFRGNERITDPEWKTQRVKALFKYLLLHRGHRIHEEQAVEILWPSSDPRVAAARLKTAVKTLRQALEPLVEGKKSHYIARAGEHLQFESRAPLWVDADEYIQRVEEARRLTVGAPAEAASAYEQAVALYRGDLLEDDPYEEWAALYRERFRETQIDVLSSLGRWYAQGGDYRRAADTIEGILLLDRLRESAYRELMVYALQRGDRQRAIQVYRRCEQLLREELGVAPAAETASVYQQAVRS